MAEPNPFELRAGMQLMQRILLRDTNVDAFRQALAETVARAPAMLRGALVVLDLSPLQGPETLPDFGALDMALRSAGVVPAGVCNAGPGQADAARAAGWGVIEGARDAVKPASQPEPTRPPARIVRHPVRSGQQVHAPGDLILLAQVSAGAEVLAGGSIYVHAPLRGRALAGIRGDETATISCSAFHAELVAVAGHYRTFETPDSAPRGGPAHVQLEGEKLLIQTI